MELNAAEKHTLSLLMDAAAGGLSDSSISAVLTKFRKGVYDDRAINVNTGKPVILKCVRVYVYFEKGPYTLAIRRDQTGDAAYHVLNKFFNWYYDCLNAGQKLQVDVDNKTNGKLLHLDFKKKWDAY